VKIIAYTRVSTSEQGNRKVEDRLGLQAQMDAIKRYCEQHGHELVAHYEEVVSGKYGLDARPSLKAAFEHAKKVDGAVLASKLDRLSRNVEFVGFLINKGWKFGTVEDGFGRQPMELYFRAMFAEEERRRISQRTTDALAIRKAQGMKLGGERGRERLERSKAVVQAEANAFAERVHPMIGRMRGLGMTTKEIADEFNSLDIPTARGGKWHSSTVTNIITRIEGECRRIR
jgi:DNA invertase Pin-like site-specific DNA recombinase